MRKSYVLRCACSAIAAALSAAVLVACGSVAPVAGFQVEIGPVGAYVPRSHTAAFSVTVRREDGFGGAVDLALRSAPVGVTALGTVDAGAGEGELLVTVGPDAALGPVALRLVASGRTPNGSVLSRDVDMIITVLDEARPSLQLIGAAGSPPPSKVYEEVVRPENAPPWLLELVVLGGVLVLDPDGSYEHLLTIDTLQDGRLVGRSRWADHGVWTAGASGWTFTSTWIAGHAFTGIRSGPDLVIEFDLYPLVGNHATAELVFAD